MGMDRIKVEERIMVLDIIKIGRRTDNKDMIMERDRIKVEERIMVVDIIKIGRRTDNKDMIMERDRIKVEERIMVVDIIKIRRRTRIRTRSWRETGSRLRKGSWMYRIQYMDWEEERE
jgi:hypothetical protein